LVSVPARLKQRRIELFGGEQSCHAVRCAAAIHTLTSGPALPKATCIGNEQ
jgi:hypothetical protein